MADIKNEPYISPLASMPDAELPDREDDDYQVALESPTPALGPDVELSAVPPDGQRFVAELVQQSMDADVRSEPDWDVAAAKAAAQVTATAEAAGGAAPLPTVPLELLDLQGFFIAAGAGVYEGATRDDEEPRDSYFVDIRDYGNGETKRIWGVHLGEVMEQAQSKRGLQPGDRIRLMQQPKRGFARPVVENNTQKVVQTFANWWEWERDTSPLPSSLKHMVDDINVDAELTAIAVRYDLTAEDPRYIDWLRDQKTMLATLGEDPQRIKQWIGVQKTLSNEEETAILVGGAQTKTYLATDAARAAWVNDTRTQLRNMALGKRFDFLMKLGKPHLTSTHDAYEARLWDSVKHNIHKVVDMTYPDAGYNQAAMSREGLHRALLESVRGMTPDQANDYLALQNQNAFERSAIAFANEPAQIKNDDGILRALQMPPGANADAYAAALDERLAQAKSETERQQIIAVEIQARQEESVIAEEDLERITRLYNRLAAERDVDVTGMLLGSLAGSLVTAFEQTIAIPLKNILVDVSAGAWRRQSASNALDDLDASLDDARNSDTYKLFANDERVVNICGERGMHLDDLVAHDPAFAKSDVAREHLAFMQQPDNDKAKKSISAKGGIFSQVGVAAEKLLAKTKAMGPNHLLKNGQLDGEWLAAFQEGMTKFTDKLKKTLVPEDFLEQIQAILKQVMDCIKSLLEQLRMRSPANERAAPSASMATAP